MKTAYNATLIYDGGKLESIKDFIALLRAGELEVKDVYWNELMNAPMIYVELQHKSSPDTKETTVDDYQSECDHHFPL